MLIAHLFTQKHENCHLRVYRDKLSLSTKKKKLRKLCVISSLLYEHQSLSGLHV